MVIKVCKICGKEFEARTPAKCCSPECSKINRKNKREVYHQSDSFKKSQQKYNQSEKGKATRQKYWQSEKGKAKRKKYNQSEKGKDSKKKYNQSEKGRKAKKEYNQKKIAELNKQYGGDLNLILKDCPHTWEEREAKMQVWFNESYIDGMFTKIKSTLVCEVTGEKNNLKIHHLYSFNTHPELGNDPANMVRITGTVHDEFHNIYGRGNNTPEQWMEFIEKQYGGD